MSAVFWYATMRVPEAGWTPKEEDPEAPKMLLGAAACCGAPNGEGAERDVAPKAPPPNAPPGEVVVAPNAGAEAPKAGAVLPKGFAAAPKVVVGAAPKAGAAAAWPKAEGAEGAPKAGAPPNAGAAVPRPKAGWDCCIPNPVDVGGAPNDGYMQGHMLD